MPWRVVVPVLALVAVAGLIAFEALSSGPGTTGQPAPPLPTAVLQAPKKTLASLRGKPALINFWASWCEPCRKEAPELERFERTLGNAGALVGVDYTDQAGAGREFVRHYGWSFPILSDPEGIYGARYRFSGLPTTVVLDPRGRIVETLRGPQTVAELRQALASASS